MIRVEKPADYPHVSKVIEAAFAPVPQSDQTEHLLVDRLRTSEAFIPELSLLALIEDEIVGHILLSSVYIIDGDTKHHVLSLAPVAVSPAHQHKGIGTALINRAHTAARKLGHGVVVLVGHADYYPRFGYRPSHLFGIDFPFDSPQECCLVLELIPNALEEVSGMVTYPSEFFQ